MSASSYIKTEGSQVTRAADNVSRALGGEFNPYELTMTFEGTLVSGDGNENYNSLYSLTDGGTTNSRTYVISWDKSSSMIRFLIYNNDHPTRTTAFIDAPGAYVSGSYVKVAAAYSKSSGLLTMSVNGALIGSVAYDVTNRMNEITTQLLCSGLRGLGELGHTTAEAHSAKYYPYALSEAELVEITS